MKIVLFCHPAFLSSQSMPRFARMLQQAYERRGYEVEVWSPTAILHRWFNFRPLAKWAGYADQYLLFPLWVKLQLYRQPADTLYVFCDQALGPWVPLVAKLPHVIHCHDFLALQSALGDYPQNPVSNTGKIYQRYIRRGFQAGRNFISVSHESKRQLARYLPTAPLISEAVHNGLNYSFAPLASQVALSELAGLSVPVLEQRMLVHVGGNTWYKNRAGVIYIYAALCRQCTNPPPLWMVGDRPNRALAELAEQVPANGKVHFISGLSNRQVQAVYSLAKALIFPSLAEGFGWPIAEAMACGCPVLTTGVAPMTEVGGEHVAYIPVMPHQEGVALWAVGAAQILDQLLNQPEEQKLQQRSAALEHVIRFDADKAITAYEEIYRRVMARDPSAQGIES